MKSLFDNSIRILALVLAAVMLLSPQTVSAQTPPPFLVAWGTPGSGPGQFGDDPLGIAVDHAGNVYVGDSGNNRVQKFTSTGVYLTEWGAFGTGDGQFTGYLTVAVDDSNNIYVADFLSERVQKFTDVGVYLMQWGGPSTGFPGEPGKFDTLAGIAVDDSFNVYTNENIPDRVQKFTSVGVFLTLWGQSGSAEGELNFPDGVAVSTDGKVTVSDSGNFRMETFSTAGAFVQMWGWGVSDGTPTFQRCTSGCRSGIPGNGDGQFGIMTYVAVDRSSRVYVADSQNDRIHLFTPDGLFLLTWGSRGSGEGEFFGPSGIAVDRDGNVYVADRLNHRIQKFGPVTMGIEPTEAPRLLLLRPFPNPSTGSFAFTVVMPQTGAASVAVVDVQGRLVRHIQSGALAAGQHTFHWDGRDGRGQPAATGLYVFLISRNGSTSSQKIMLYR